ncbi:hypothetical protein [Mesorhizobium sp. 1B3]|uniref:hypothetical protein n=1 Tax=Mesorhizobium sp. 1B3 TaxID=3243599 RepID=UPI003D997116
MIRAIVIAVMLAFGLASSNANEEGAVDQSVAFWKSVGHWTVWVDRTVENGCFIATAFEDSTVLRLGFVGIDRNLFAYIGVGNEQWKSLEEGKDYELVIQMDGRNPWRAEASVMKIGGKVPFLVAEASEAEFFKEFMRKHSLTISYKGTVVVTLDLKGSAAAMRELLTCQETFEAEAKRVPDAPKKDPFEGVSSQKDPFAL